MNIVEEIKGAVVSSGVSYNEIARRSGLSVSVVSKVMNGHRESPSVFTVASIASAIGLQLTLISSECQPK